MTTETGRQPTERERQKWLRRAHTIATKAEALQGEMIAALGTTHVWTDYTDNVVDHAGSLVAVIERNVDRRHT